MNPSNPGPEGGVGDLKCVVRTLVDWAIRERNSRDRCVAGTVNWFVFEASRAAFLLSARIAAMQLRKGGVR